MTRKKTRTAHWLVLTGLITCTLPSAFGQQALPTAATEHDQGYDHSLDELLHSFDAKIQFTQNLGQFSEGVLYRADLPLGQAIATPVGMVITAFDAKSVEARQQEGMRIEQEMHDGRPSRPLLWNRKGHAWRMRFMNAREEMRVSTREAHPEVSNYFVGHAQALNVPSYQEVWYNDVYRGVDVRYYPAADGSLEYDVICAPGSDPREIAIQLEGIDHALVNEKGELAMTTSLGEMTYPAPVVYQRIGGREKRIEARYRIKNANILCFDLGRYDTSRALVIDPIAMRWATWVNTNSTGDNHGHCIWVDPNDGAVYVVARVVGTTDQITPGAFDETANGNLEMIVGKYLEPASVGGSGTRVWQTYIGGNNDDNPYAMEQGPDGNLYITGLTGSTNFPLLGGPAFSGTSIDQQAQSGDDIFVLKINTAGNSIKSCVIGGNGTENSYDVRLTSAGDVIVCGGTTATNLLTLNPGSGASNTNNGGTDALIFKVNQDLSALAWMKNYGGSGTDLPTIMLNDAATGDIYVGGYTTSTNFPTVSPRQATRGGSQAGFLQRLESNGTTTWSSYFSSASGSSAQILCMEFNTAHTELYFGGLTSGLAAANISGSGVFDSSYNNGTDFFVCRMETDQDFVAATYVGGSGAEANMMGLNTDQNDDVYVFGYTASTNFPVSASPNIPLQSTNQGNNDKVFLKLGSDLSSLVFSTYYGGSSDDYDPVGERGIKFSNCRIYTIVTAQSNNIPLTQGALNTTKTSATSRYEPGLVVWANPPDLLGNTIDYTGTAICAGTIPADILGSAPSYVLPTIVRNGTSSAYPAFPPAATFQWQISLDSLVWNDIPGATGQDLPGAQIGVVNQTTYFRRIIGGDACILAGAADQVVTVRIMSASGTMTPPSCFNGSDGSITATADGQQPFTFAWSDGQTTETAVGLAAGNYSVIVTDANGCSAQADLVLGQPTPVSGNTSTNDATCGNNNGNASVSGTGGTPGYTYAWSTGAIGPVLNGEPAGSYDVTITDANQCTAVLNVQIGGTTPPIANAGADAVITCNSGSQVQLDGSGSSPGVVFSWSGPGIVSGSGTSTPLVDAPGIYTLLVTAGNGCTASDIASVSANTNVPDADAGSGGTLTCALSSILLDGSSTTPGVTFAWSGPGGFASSDEDVIVTEPGIYSLTVTDPVNGCTSTDQAQVTQNNEVPGAVATGGVLDCNTPSVMLSASGNGAYSWSGPGGFTSNDQNPVVSVPGVYVLTVTGANGCTSTDQAQVTQNNEVPGAVAAGGVLDCNTPSVMLSASGNGAYSWSGPGGFASNDQNPVVSVPGVYVLTVTGANGCTSTDQAQVTQNNEVPGAVATGGVLDCNTPSVMLSASGNGAYSWSGPGGFTSNDQNPVVSVPGVYILTVTGANGCTSTDQAQVTQNNEVPGAVATGGVLDCNTPSVMLSASGNGAYSWSGPGGFASNDQNPVVSVPGVYVLTVTGANGCTSTDQAQVTQNNEVPGAVATGGVLDCNTPSVMLSASGNGAYSWSGPGGFASNDQNPVVSVPGVYILTVTGANGCTSTDQAQVTQNNEVPGAVATGGVLDCNTPSVSLSASGNGAYSWSGPGGFTSNDQNPVVSVPGVYVLTVTGDNGCTSTDQAQVTQDNEVPGAVATGGVLDCNTPSVSLSASGNGAYSWSGPGGFTSNDQNPVVSVPGVYVLTVTGDNGCTSTDQAQVTQDNEVPGAVATGGVLDCNTPSVMLSASGNGAYSWSGPGGFTSNDQNPVVSVPGVYVLTVTGDNGCTSTDQAQVTQNNEVPGAVATGGVLDCNTPSVSLSASGNGAYSWSGPGGFTSNDQNPVVSVPGVYVLTVTGDNGCTSTDQAQVTQDNEVPGAVATGGVLDCNTPSVSLSASGNGAYSWSGPGGFTSNDQNPVVSVPGVYVLTVTGDNGCTSTDQAQVTQDNEVPGAVATGGVLDCNTPSVSLSASGNGAYSWSGPGGFTSNDQNPVVSVPGVYVLTVTGDNGCTSTDQAQVTQNNEVPGAVAAGGVLDCNTPSVSLSASGNGAYSWSGPGGFTSNDQNPVVSVPGVYVLTVTGDNGCTSTDQAQVTQDNEVPGAVATGGVLDCNTPSVSLSASGNGAYSWSGPGGFTSNDQNPVVSVPGVYVLTVTGDNGCTSTDQAQVTQDNEVPGAVATGGVLDCNTPSVSLSASGNGAYSWSGPGGFISNDQNPVVSVPGVYVLTVTGANGCTSTDQADVNADFSAPDVSATGAEIGCDESPVQLNGGSTSPGAQFAWTSANGFSSGDEDPFVSQVGFYTLTVTGTNGCTSIVEVAVTHADCNQECSPLLVCPPDTTVQCGTNLDYTVVGEPIIRKDPKCPAMEFVTWTDVYTGDCPVILSRTWTVGDVDGNVETCTQTITIVDELPPTLVGVPANLEVACANELPEAPTVYAEDNCKSAWQVGYTEVVNKAKGSCSYEVVRTWVAADDCGNTTSAEQTITVNDGVAPVFNCEPTTVTVACDGVPKPFKCEATDNCDTEPDYTFAESRSDEDEAGNWSLTWTWTATDDCGNTSTLVQVINVLCEKKPLDAKASVNTYPNPFRSGSRFTVHAASTGRHLLELFDSSGRPIRTILDESIPSGAERNAWLNGEDIGEGVYYYRLSHPSGTETGRIVHER